MAMLSASSNLRARNAHSWTPLLNIVSSIAAAWQVRRAARSVETLSDESLRDIGITRSEIDSAVRFGRYHRL